MVPDIQTRIINFTTKGAKLKYLGTTVTYQNIDSEEKIIAH
jgi:hypothetical protein